MDMKTPTESLACKVALALTSSITIFVASVGWANDAPNRTWKFNDYTITVERTSGGGIFDQDLLTIRRSGKLIHAEIAQHVEFISPAAGESQLPELESITSPTPRDIVIESYSGGAHCCFSIEVATLADQFDLSAPLVLRDVSAALIKLPQGEVYGFRSADQSYAYRWTGFAESPSPEIVLRYDQKRGFTVAIDLMRKPKLPREPLQTTAQKMRDDTETWKNAGDSPPADYLRAVMGLVYAGDEDGARQFAFAAWPDWKPGLEKFVSDLYGCALPSGPWWAAIAELNGIKPYVKSEQCRS